MQNTPIRPTPSGNISIAKDRARNDTAATPDLTSKAPADSVVVSVPLPRPKTQDLSDPATLVAAVTKALSSTDSIASAHGNLDLSRVHDLLSED
jgi:hypothetical protein